MTQSLSSEDKSLEEVVDAEERQRVEDATIRAKFDYKTQQKLLRKVDLHLLPLLILAYLLKNIDGNLISFVKTMNAGTSTNIATQLNISNNDYAWLNTAFTIGFVLLEVPSALFLKIQTPRWHYVRILVSWSIACACQAAAKNLAGLVVARVFLGLFEGGLFPGIIVQLTYWYRPDEISTRLAVIGVLGQFSGIICALLTYGFSFVSGNGGLSAWQWVFILCGVAGIPIAGAIALWQPDFPDTAKFLTEDERKFIVARLPPNSSRATDADFSWAEIKEALRSPLLWSFSSLFVLFNTGATGYSFWLPSVIAQLGFASGPRVQLLNIPPAAIFVIIGIGSCYLADRSTNIPRPVYSLVPTIAVMGFFFGLAFATQPGTLYACIMLVALCYAVFANSVLPWRAQTLKGATYSAFAYSFQNAVAQLVSLYSGQIFRAQYAPRYRVPYFVCIGFFGAAAIAIIITWYLTYDSELETRRVRRDRAKLGKETGEILADDVKSVGVALSAGQALDKNKN